MSRFIPITQQTELPVVGRAIERPVMDWKATGESFPFEKAKDVAAFANHIGGTIVIGAAESNGQLVKYVGLDPAAAGKVRSEYSSAVASRCLPRPAIDPQEFQCPGDATKRVVAINVPASLNLVGVKLLTNDKAKEGYGGVSVVFPVRFGTDARYLEPDQLAMFMTPQIRRIAVMLSKIPRGTRVLINRSVPTTILGGARATHSYAGLIEEVLEEENVVTFRGDEGQEMRRLPLDCISTVYEDWDSDKKRHEWRVVVNLDP